MRAIKGFAVVVLMLVGAVALQAALPFLFWLPSAKRDNANDPKSNLFFPTNTVNTTPLGTLTQTQTFTFSPTNSITKTNSPSPSFSPTAAGTFTATPTITVTLTPSPTPSNTPSVPTPTPTIMVNTVLYDDFENPPCGLYQYDDGTSTPAFGASILTQDLVTYKNGISSAYGTYQSGTSWGGGFGFLPMGCALSVLDARSISPTYVYVWIKTDQPLNVYFTIAEDSATTGDTEEHWTNAGGVAVSASPSWQIVEAPFTDFSLNGYYHGCGGGELCNPSGNNIIDAAVYNFDIQFGADAVSTLANFYLDDAGFADGPQAPPAPIKVDDFEGALCYDGVYCDDGNCADGNATDLAKSYSTAVFHAGAKSLYLQAKVDSTLATGGADGYGGGFYWGYPVGCGGDVNIAGKTKLEYWVKTDYAVNMKFILRESVSVDPNRPGVAGEYWENPPVSIPVAGGAWQLVSIPLSAFTVETAASIALAPPGDDIFNMIKIFDIQIQFTTDQVGPPTMANVYIDDMYFVP